jgi:hypothetical protein
MICLKQLNRQQGGNHEKVFAHFNLNACIVITILLQQAKTEGGI